MQRLHARAALVRASGHRTELKQHEPLWQHPQDEGHGASACRARSDKYEVGETLVCRVYKKFGSKRFNANYRLAVTQ